MKDLRYLNSKKVFLEFSYLALQEQFPSKDELVCYFNLIKSDEQKNIFLKIASFYLFLVKQGNWVVKIPGSNQIIDYLTDTYKYIAIFSLIESLQDRNYIDFYSFLIRGKSNVEFPIKNKKELDKWYREYKKDYGSIRQSVDFFKSLSKGQQTTLIKKLEVKDTEPTIENLSSYLYELRSKFVHKAEVILNMSEGTYIGKKHNKLVICKLSIKDMMRFFEEGLINYFSTEKHNQTVKSKQRNLFRL